MKLFQVAFAFQLLSGVSAGRLGDFFGHRKELEEEKVGDVRVLEAKSPEEDHRELTHCPGNQDPKWFCMQELNSNEALAISNRNCYNNQYDCYCRGGYNWYGGPWGHTKILGACHPRVCHEDTTNGKDWFCKWAYGPGGIPKSSRTCYDTADDCECDTADPENDWKWKLVYGYCKQCAKEPFWFCKAELSVNAIPRSGRTCYDTADDCKCMPNWFTVNTPCDTHCPDGQQPHHGVCEPVPELCMYDGEEWCHSICGDHGKPKDDLLDIADYCWKWVEDCECEEGYHPIDGTCQKPPSGYGDPHFVTFHGHDYEFQGECDLVLVHAPTVDMDIHVRTTIRYDYSFISQVAVRRGKHIFEVGSWGEYQLDGIQTSDLPAFIDGHPITVEVLNPIKKKFRFTIHLEDDKAIRIVSFKDYVSVKLLGTTAKDFADASGLMGHYVSGDMLGRDGRTAMDNHPNEFGMEWQVRPDEDGQLFSDAREPQYPNDRCRMPSASAIHARDRKLGEAGINHEAAEAACAGVKLHPEQCVGDVLKSQDLDMAEIYRD